ncbi:hypothetical protein C1A50_2968 [Paenibacillus polymyxa]|nr:hypothetical protein C1A50_2968 [Paenibacillus polymyxa]
MKKSQYKNAASRCILYWLIRERGDNLLPANPTGVCVVVQE